MINWYALKPVDTLFFKGAMPMVMGENHTAEFRFPPPAHTIAGAVRSAVLRQNEIPFDLYCGDGFDNSAIIASLGRAGEDPPFTVMGPLMEMDGDVYIPAPFIWYMEKEDKAKDGAVPVYRSRPVNASIIRTEHPERLYVARGRNGELTSMGGRWINLEDFFSGKDKMVVRETSFFYCPEPRTGIALDAHRRVRESHLYSFTHARLREDVRILFGIVSDLKLPMSESGMLYLGGEQRMGFYEPVEINIQRGAAAKELFMGLSDIRITNESESALIASGKIQYIGGWDMKRGFHKPALAHYPAGSVFKKNLNNLIPLQEEKNV